MIKRIGVILSALLILFCLQPLQAQDVNNFKNQFNRHFDYASRVLSLA